MHQNANVFYHKDYGKQNNSGTFEYLPTLEKTFFYNNTCLKITEYLLIHNKNKSSKGIYDRLPCVIYSDN